MTPDIQSLATRLMAAAGLADAPTIVPLAGGRNNRVFRVGDRVVLKLYHHDPRDPRDRLATEWAFLRHAWDRGVHNIPHALACDTDAHAGLYSYLPGRKLAACAVTLHHVDAALAFVRAIGVGPCTLPPGSEACFSIGEHLATIERRVARLEALPQPPALVAAQLRPIWNRVRQRPMALDVDRRIEACVSPSDFGFHNALVDGDRVCCIDFEYAGRDDPAKLVCDFFCQPEVPVPIGFLPHFLDGLELAGHDADQCYALLDAYRVKWACIVLNDFLPMGSARRHFAGSARSADAALQRAAAKLLECERD